MGVRCRRRGRFGGCQVNAHAAERVRSYLRGRLQRPVGILPDGRFTCSTLTQREVNEAGASGDFYAITEATIEGTLPEIEAYFHVKVPDSILKGLIDGHDS